MDATASGNGFDAALKALEDLETSVAETRDAQPAAAPPSEPVAIGPIAFGEGEEPAAAAITAVPAAEADPVIPPAAISAPAPELVVEATADPVETAPPVVEAPVAVAVAAQPAAPSGRFGKLVVGLALLSSILSAAGLVVAERTIMSAQLVVADARERQHQLEQSTKLIQDLELVRDKQVELLKAQQAQLAAAPVSSDELQHRLEVLQGALAQRDPVNDVVTAIRSGQADTNARFNEIGMKIERLEAAARGH